jgi:hypothetical protein
MRITLALALILLPGAAVADEPRYASDTYWHTVQRDPVHRVEHRPHRHHRRHVHKPAPAPPPPAPIVPSYHSALCLGEVRAHGTPHLTEAAAMDAAKRHWQAVVRYDFGEKFMSIETASSIKYRCARAETNETAAGRIAEAVSGEAWRMRCEVVAHPCRSQLKEAP